MITSLSRYRLEDCSLKVGTILDGAFEVLINSNQPVAIQAYIVPSNWVSSKGRVEPLAHIVIPRSLNFKTKVWQPLSFGLVLDKSKVYKELHTLLSLHCQAFY